MPTGFTNSRQPEATSTGVGDVIGFGEYIDRQLTKVRTFVRLSDLAVAITACTAVVSAVLFALILVDHWLFDLGHIGRAAALVTLLGIVSYFSFIWILPLVAKRMNPAYVAHVIEQGEPSLKNGLLNFVLFRSQPHSVRKVILEAVERRAAVDLSRINVDTTIDRTPLIRIGAALAALLVGLALYAIVSPKDPLETIARVLIPWSDRARPSRVRILDVEPGSTTVYSGHQLAVRARIENLGESERAIIVYSTLDGQVVDGQLDMRANGDARWSAKLPETTDGLQQNVTYRIAAGDAVAGPFRVNVLPSPSIVVNRLEYDYPDYTLRDSMVIERAGDINALEGTRVTINATANQDIDYAYVEYDAFDTADDTVHDDDANARQTLTMKHDGRTAWTSFTLRLQPDRRTPWHLNYQIRFRNLDGATNDRPIRYDIHVTPDMPPVVEILTPSKIEMDLPLDATQSIEIRALDPDYGLTEIKLRAVADGAPLLDENLLNRVPRNNQSTAAFTGQQVVKYAFTPGKLGLQSGDVVVYWARASDNRTDPSTSTEAPNVTKTQEYRFHITDAEKSRDKPSETDETAPTENGDNPRKNDGAGDNNQGDTNNGETNQGETSQGSDADETDGNKRDNASAGNDDEQKSNDSIKNEDKQGQQEGAPDNNDEARNQDAQQDEHGNQGRQADNNQDSDGTRDQQQDQTNEGGQPNGDQGKAGADGDGQGARDADAPQGTSDENQSSKANGNNAGETNKDRSAQADADEGHSDDTVDREASQTEQKDGGVKSAQSASDGATSAEDSTKSDDDWESDDDSQPLPNDGSREGDAMERILKEIRDRTGKQPEDATHKPCDNCSDGSCENCQNAAQGNPSGDKSGSGSPSNKNGSSSNGRNDSQRPADNNTERKGTGGSQQDAASQHGDSQTNDPRDAESTDASQSDQPGHEAVKDSRSQGDSGEAQQGTSDQPNSDDASDETGDSDSETDRQSTPSGDNATDPTGKSDESGNPDGPNAEQPGKPNESLPAADQDNPADPNGASASTGQGATAPEGGTSSSARSESASSDMNESDADEANLEYARKATDLVLEYLKDQKNRRDRGLLDKLGWSPEELEKFRQRWERMKRDAEQNGPVGVSARRELDEVLRSLGLAPARDRLQAAGSRNDRVQVRNTGRTNKPPASYRERYERFLKSVSNHDSSP